ncbi:ADP-ribosylhydrolase ARH3-like [Amphiura filiformis]|uniref:ADP-ribosylhydrolase ARH3-like n=1 Tax=Amphiura filiformis TaxID=82378 RepID=UPI003B21DB4D
MMSAVRASLRSRFQGCLVGGVIGDCVGAPFEVTGSGGSPRYVRKFAEKIPSVPPGSLQFTDDTAMARSITASLIQHNGEYKPMDMAKRFASEYSKEPGRGYGGNVIDVFAALGDDKLKDAYEPAKKQFGGSGSYGNGGAMRVAPVGLCMEERFIQMIEIAKSSAQITHSNALGYNGAILQACAVHLALHADPKTFCRCTYVDKLIGIMSSQEKKDPDDNLKGAKRARMTFMGKEMSDDEVSDDESGGPETQGVYCHKLRVLKNGMVLTRGERDDLYGMTFMGKEMSDDEVSDEESGGPETQGVYCHKLRVLKKFLEKADNGTDVRMDDVVEHLGNRISAHYSVPTAIYCFLNAMHPMNDFPDYNAFQRTILYAIALDGDTDTIASMAGAIAGAYYGIEAIPKPWITACEGAEDALKKADDLYSIMVNTETSKEGAATSDEEK